MFSDSPTILLPLKTSNYWESTIKRVPNLLHEVFRTDEVKKKKKKIHRVTLQWTTSRGNDKEEFC